MAWLSAETGLKTLCNLLFTAEEGAKHPFKRQLHVTHVCLDYCLKKVQNKCGGSQPKAKPRAH